MKLFDKTQTSFHFHNCNEICFNWDSCDCSCLIQQLHFISRSLIPFTATKSDTKTQNQDTLHFFFPSYSSISVFQVRHVGGRAYPSMHWAEGSQSKSQQRTQANKNESRYFVTSAEFLYLRSLSGLKHQSALHLLQSIRISHDLQC